MKLIKSKIVTDLYCKSADSQQYLYHCTKNEVFHYGFLQ